MERAFKIGCRVVFFDEYRRAHNAIVTNWFHAGPDGETLEEYNARNGTDKMHGVYMPCCNIVWVSPDKSKEDPYGRQIERATSITYGRQAAVPFTGYCWAWPDEEEEAKELAAVAYERAVAK